MNTDKIKRIAALNDEIQNFKTCYSNLSSQLWGERDECVSAETLLAFLIENPYFQDIADKVQKLDFTEYNINKETNVTIINTAKLREE